MPTGHKSSIQFIQHSDFDGNASARSQRQIRSHAARIAHARIRVSRMRDYRKQTADELLIRDENARTKEIPGAKIEIEASTLASPLTLLSSHRRDQFGCSVVPLKPVEHFLLDHCKLAHLIISNHLHSFVSFKISVAWISGCR